MHQFGRICRQNWQNNIRPIRLSASNVNRLIFLPYIVPTTKSARQHSTEQNAPCKIPATQLETKAHSLGWETIQAQVEPYFSQNWKFSSEAKRKGFLAIGLSRAFSNSFPLTLDDRVGVTCQMLYLSLLIDDQLEKMSFAQMLSYRHRIMQVVFGTVSPDMGTSHEWMLYDTLQTMRTIDKRLANDVARGFCQLLKAMTSQERGSISTLGSYLDFREVDVGRTFYTILMRFGAKLHLTEDQLAKTKSLESTAFRHVSVINDIYSWEREWKVSQASPSDGAQPFSAVSILAKETGLPFPACKRLLYSYCRELEIVFKETGHKIRNDSSTNLTPELEKYLHGLELFMSGIETWSRWTPRYRQ